MDTSAQTRRRMQSRERQKQRYASRLLQSTVAPERLITSLHFAISLLMYAASSAGLETIGVMPSLTICVPSAPLASSTQSSCRRLMTAGGVPRGVSSAYHTPDL